MKKLILYSSFGILLCLLHVQKTRADCIESNDLSHIEECMDLRPHYNGSQWVTNCVSNAYIQQKSNGKYFCYSAYCYYPCMLERHNIYLGYYEPVYDDCACEENAIYTTQQFISVTTLPSWCFEPSGQDCMWYRQCLEKRYPCEGTPDAYAITFAETFCNRYTTNARNFSAIGQIWINSVRQCLQNELAQTILNSVITYSCEKILQNAFNSHSVCYLAKDRGAPSVCDLPPSDWLEIYKTISPGIIPSGPPGWESGIDIIKGCSKQWYNQKYLVKIWLNIELENFKRQIKSASEEVAEFAGTVADAIATKLGWRNSGIMWYAYSNSSSLTSSVPVDILITGNGTHHLDNAKVSDFNLTAIVEKTVEAVQDGYLFFRDIGDKYWSIYVKQMIECMDFECRRPTQNVIAPANKYKSSVFSSTNDIMHTISTLFICFIVITVL